MENMYLPLWINDLDFHLLLLPTTSTSAKNLIKVFHVIFGQYGYPRKIISENGPPFKSNEIKDYFSKHAIIHHRITPY